MLFSLSISPAGAYLFTPQGGGGSPPPAGWPQSPSGAYASAGFDPKNGLYGSWDGTTFTTLTAAAMVSNPSLIQAGVGYVISSSDATAVLTMPEAVSLDRTFVVSFIAQGAPAFVVNNADDSQEVVTITQRGVISPPDLYADASGYDAGSGSWATGTQTDLHVATASLKVAVSVTGPAQSVSVNGQPVVTPTGAYDPTVTQCLIGGYTAGAVFGSGVTVESVYTFPHQADANLPTLSTP